MFKQFLFVSFQHVGAFYMSSSFQTTIRSQSQRKSHGIWTARFAPPVPPHAWARPRWVARPPGTLGHRGPRPAPGPAGHRSLETWLCCFRMAIKKHWKKDEKRGWKNIQICFWTLDNDENWLFYDSCLLLKSFECILFRFAVILRHHLPLINAKELIWLTSTLHRNSRRAWERLVLCQLTAPFDRELIACNNSNSWQCEAWASDVADLDMSKTHKGLQWEGCDRLGDAIGQFWDLDRKQFEIALSISYTTGSIVPEPSTEFDFQCFFPNLLSMQLDVHLLSAKSYIDFKLTLWLNRDWTWLKPMTYHIETNWFPGSATSQLCSVFVLRSIPI